MLGIEQDSSNGTGDITPPPAPEADPQSTAAKWQLALHEAGTSDPRTVASSAPQHSGLADAWDWTKHQASAAGHAIGHFDVSHGHVLTRAGGAAQAVGGAAEAIAGAATAGVGGTATATGVGAAPGIPAMVGGGLLAANGADNAVAGLRTALTGEFHHTLTSQAAGATAHALGASSATADRITDGVDLAQGVAGGGASIAAGIMRKGAATTLEHAGQLAGDGARMAPHAGPEAAQTATRADQAGHPINPEIDARASHLAHASGAASDMTPHTAAKLIADPKLDFIDRHMIKRAGEFVANDRIANAHYSRLQAQGTNVHFVNDRSERWAGLFEGNRNKITINLGHNTDVKEVASTIVHEATHQERFFKGKPLGNQYEEYRAFRNEAYFNIGRRPSLAQRQQIWEDVKRLYPHLPEGRNPFEAAR